MRQIIKIEYFVVFILIFIGIIGTINTSKQDREDLENNYEEAILYLGMHVNKLLSDGDLITLNRIIKSIRQIQVAVYRNETEIIASNFDNNFTIKELKQYSLSDHNRFYRSPVYQDGKLIAQVFILEPSFISLYWKKYFLMGSFFLLMLSTIFLWLKKQKDVQDIKMMANYLSNDQIENLNLKMSSYNSYLYEQLINYRKKILQLSNKLKQQAEIEAKELVSKQVAHDIRSPLAALNMISKDFSTLPESTRVMLRSSVNRIQDIANNLLKPINQINNANDESTSETLLTQLIEELISEKRTELRSFQNITIDTNNANSYGIFVKINQSLMKRIISNILNNCIDAFLDKKGQILISYKKINHKVQIVVSDNGIGIPEHILPLLCQNGATFGKSDLENSGSGLGLFHAKKTLSKWGGHLNINSIEGKGTDVTITLPLLKAPEWFISSIKVQENSNVVIIDDDTSIHQVWKKRFSSLISENKINLIHFSSPSEVNKWLGENSLKNTIFLCDYEFINHIENGLDIIEKNNICNQSILVTSRFAENIIRERCVKLGIKLIPKMMSEIAPINIIDNKTYDLIHLDDDELIRLSWKLSAKKEGKEILSLENYDLLKKELVNITLETPFYIDSSLGEKSLKGELIAKELYELGYKELFMSTGYQKDEFINMPWIKGVIGKRAPFSESLN